MASPQGGFLHFSRFCLSSEPVGRASEPARRALDPVGRTSEQARRALEEAGRVSEPAGRAPKPAGKASRPAALWGEGGRTDGRKKHGRKSPYVMMP